MCNRKIDPAVVSSPLPKGHVLSNLTALMEKAATAIPSESSLAPSRRWVRLLPIYRTLINRGFQGTSAIDWLIEQGEVKKVDRKRAFFALHQALNRLRRRELASPRI